MTRRTFHSLALAAGASALAQEGSRKAKPIRIGQIGTRHAHAAGQLAALRKCPDFEFVGIVEPDEKRRLAMQHSADYAGLNWMTEEELLNTSGLQAVAVETEVGSLLDHAERIVKAGLHLHLDKPAGESLPQLKRLFDSAIHQQRIIKMGYVYRFNPAFQRCYEAVEKGWLGQVFSLHTEMSKKASAAERAALLPYKGGSMFELGGHIIDAAVRVLGRPEKVTSFARSFPKDGFNDNMLAVLEYPNATVTVRSALMEVNGGARRQFVVCGDQGTCEIRKMDGPTLSLTLDHAVGPYAKGRQEVTLPPSPRYEQDWQAFAQSIRGEMEWPWKPAHDLAVQETLLLASGMPIV